MAVTRNDVARLAGVSPATVSYVVNNGPRPVSAETRRQVLAAIEKLGYQPSAVARSLKTKRTTTIGVIVSDILNPVLSAVAKGIEDAILPLHYNMILCNSDEDPERELTFIKMLLSKQVDGIILMPTGRNIKFLSSITQNGHLPIVLLDRQVEGLLCDSVLFDNRGGAYKATKHLIDQGHRRIALLSLPRKLTPGKERAAGYEQALREAEIGVDPALITEGSFKAEEGQRLVESLLSVQNAPTALLVSNNRLLNGVLQYAKERGIRIPQDVALAVFDDVSHYAFFSPSITAVAADVTLFGQEAARLLEAKIGNRESDEPLTVRIPCRLIVRESTVGARVS